LKADKHPKKPEKPETPAAKPKPEPIVHPKPADDARRAKLAQEEHDAEMARLANQLGRPGPVPMLGTTGRPSSAYEAKIRAAVLANLHFAPPEVGVDGIYAEFEVHLLPATGELAGEPRLLHPSGLPGWDEAVRRAIMLTDPFPRREDGSAPRLLDLKFYPKDIQ
jgi:colicin import membrane protein